jgi:hypothetical protein
VQPVPDNAHVTPLPLESLANVAVNVNVSFPSTTVSPPVPPMVIVIAAELPPQPERRPARRRVVVQARIENKVRRDAFRYIRLPPSNYSAMWLRRNMAHELRKSMFHESRFCVVHGLRNNVAQKLQNGPGKTSGPEITSIAADERYYEWPAQRPPRITRKSGDRE